MDGNEFPYYAALPLLVFGPLFGWLLYTFGLRELFKMPAEIRQRRRHDAELAAEFATEHDRKRGPGAGPSKRSQVLRSPVAWACQILFFAAFALFVGALSDRPTYRVLAPDRAVLKLSLSHPGQHQVECRRRTAKELADLPPNLRKRKVCSRERWPVRMELRIDGQVIHRESAAPRGLSDDGPSSVYRIFRVAAGRHHVRLGISDDGRPSGFNFEHGADVELVPGQAMVIGFDDNRSRIFFE